jgi:hypothetical protein
MVNDLLVARQILGLFVDISSRDIQNKHTTQKPGRIDTRASLLWKCSPMGNDQAADLRIVIFEGIIFVLGFQV